MKTIYPKGLSVPELQAILQGAVAPRPIAFASTIDKEGNVNLSPFSFFNMFSANPPILIFSPSRRVRDNTTKHTLENVLEVPEVVIHIVGFELVEQMSLASTEYPKGVNEFEKAGLTAVTSDLVSPPRVKEAPVAFECKVNEVKSLGDGGGAGNLVICEVIKIHLSERILDSKGVIDPHKLDPVARLGGNWYSKITPDSLFQIPKPLTTLGIGVDQIPDFVKKSPVFNGNDLGMLGNVESLPTNEEINIFVRDNIQVKGVLSSADEMKVHEKAKEFLNKQDAISAWKVLLAKRV